MHRPVFPALQRYFNDPFLHECSSLFLHSLHNQPPLLFTDRCIVSKSGEVVWESQLRLLAVIFQSAYEHGYSFLETCELLNRPSPLFSSSQGYLFQRVEVHKNNLNKHIEMFGSCSPLERLPHKIWFSFCAHTPVNTVFFVPEKKRNAVGKSQLLKEAYEERKWQEEKQRQEEERRKEERQRQEDEKRKDEKGKREKREKREKEEQEEQKESEKWARDVQKYQQIADYCLLQHCEYSRRSMQALQEHEKYQQRYCLLQIQLLWRIPALPCVHDLQYIRFQKEHQKFEQSVFEKRTLETQQRLAKMQEEISDMQTRLASQQNVIRERQKSHCVERARLDILEKTIHENKAYNRKMYKQMVAPLRVQQQQAKYELFENQIKERRASELQSLEKEIVNTQSHKEIGNQVKAVEESVQQVKPRATTSKKHRLRKKDYERLDGIVRRCFNKWKRLYLFSCFVRFTWLKMILVVCTTFFRILHDYWHSNFLCLSDKDMKHVTTESQKIWCLYGQELKTSFRKLAVESIELFHLCSSTVRCQQACKELLDTKFFSKMEYIWGSSNFNQAAWDEMKHVFLGCVARMETFLNHSHFETYIMTRVWTEHYQHRHMDWATKWHTRFLAEEPLCGRCPNIANLRLSNVQLWAVHWVQSRPQKSSFFELLNLELLGVSVPKSDKAFLLVRDPSLEEKENLHFDNKGKKTYESLHVKINSSSSNFSDSSSSSNSTSSTLTANNSSVSSSTSAELGSTRSSIGSSIGSTNNNNLQLIELDMRHSEQRVLHPSSSCTKPTFSAITTFPKSNSKKPALTTRLTSSKSRKKSTPTDKAK